MAQKTILVVDDDAALVDTLTTILESAGYRVVGASGRADAWKKLQGETPDLAIVDVMMESETEGFHLTYDVRADERLKKMPVIMLTAINQKLPFHFSPVEDEEFIPVQKFIEKPVDPATLLKEVGSLLA